MADKLLWTDVDLELLYSIDKDHLIVDGTIVNCSSSDYYNAVESTFNTYLKDIGHVSNRGQDATFNCALCPKLGDTDHAIDIPVECTIDYKGSVELSLSKPFNTSWVRVKADKTKQLITLIMAPSNDDKSEVNFVWQYFNAPIVEHE